MTSCRVEVTRFWVCFDGHGGSKLALDRARMESVCSWSRKDKDSGRTSRKNPHAHKIIRLALPPTPSKSHPWSNASVERNFRRTFRTIGPYKFPQEQVWTNDWSIWISPEIRMDQWRSKFSESFSLDRYWSIECSPLSPPPKRRNFMGMGVFQQKELKNARRP